MDSDRIDLFIEKLRTGELPFSEVEQAFNEWEQQQQRKLDPLGSNDDRAIVAENMLEQYHMLRTNLNIRQAIVKTLTQSYGPLSTAVQNANNLVTQAQAELDQCKYEILELMGVDS